MNRSEAGHLLSEEAKRFASRGWMMGTAGNLSVQVSEDPLRFYITASGKDKGELGDDDVALAGQHGEPVTDPARPNAPKPSAEAGLHARVYALTGAGAVFHVHTVSAVLAAEKHRAKGFLEVQGLEMLKGIGREAENDVVKVPIIDNSQDMKILGERFEKALSQRTPGMLVHSHGLYAWGKDALQARHHVEILEWLFQYLAA